MSVVVPSHAGGAGGDTGGDTGATAREGERATHELRESVTTEQQKRKENNKDKDKD